MPDNTKSPPEPSMEEIIASISRIITEDQKSGAPPHPAAAEKTDILELTEMVDEDGSVRRVTPLADKPQAASGGREGSGDPPQAGEAAGAEPPSAGWSHPSSTFR